MEHIALKNNNETAEQYSADQRQILLKIACESIKYGVEHSKALSVNPSDYDSELVTPAATFVTLHKESQLRGCIGSLMAHQPLVNDIADNAYSAGFRDPRFPQLTANELELLEVHISILTPPEPISFTSKENLLQQIRPNIDGLILSDGFNRGTFLPSVWEQLPGKEEFLNNLLMKAGLPPNYWSDSIKMERYETICFGDRYAKIKAAP